jgi:SAM-dependent methyltransferase
MPIHNYLRRLYARTMTEAYAYAYRQLEGAASDDGLILDCGAGSGHGYQKLASATQLRQQNYRGLEWDAASVAKARHNGLDVVQADLNNPIPYPDDTFQAIVGFSVLEHLLMPCQFLRECHRVLKPGGTLVILTPNIATYFTAALVLLGRMPSSGPHPDSELLMSSRPLTSLAAHLKHTDRAMESDTPVHRHLVVFSFTDLRRFLQLARFRTIAGRGFGVYPFPNFMQPVLERLDARHAHQMVFTAVK